MRLDMHAASEHKAERFLVEKLFGDKNTHRETKSTKAPKPMKDQYEKWPYNGL